tara:strand:- start:356 stop:997 length:642 start_codon:yes stop_codon:yes gene_type:complete
MKVDIRNHSGMTGIEQVAEELYKFAQKQLQFNKPCRIVFESQGDRAVDIFSPTGHYKPTTHTATIYVDHRHPKDILRSMAHELIHHAQCCAGQFEQGVSTPPGYAQSNQHMREMEKDAYFRGNITLFRDWEDNYKQGRTLMNENMEQIEEEKGEEGPYDKERAEFDKDLDGVPDGADKDEDDPEVQEEQKVSDKDWYQNQLHDALLKKFNIKK